MNNSAGFELTRVLSLIQNEHRKLLYNNKEGGIKLDGGDNDENSNSNFIMKFRRVILGLDNVNKLAGGRVLGLACRQLPLIGGGYQEDKEDVVKYSGLNFNYVKSEKMNKNDNNFKNIESQDWILDATSTHQTPHAVRDESLLGAGFALYYSTGPMENQNLQKMREKNTNNVEEENKKVKQGEEEEDASPRRINALSDDKTLSLTLGYIGPKFVGCKKSSRDNIDLHAIDILEDVVKMLIHESKQAITANEEISGKDEDESKKTK